jgi:hypothetical protein
MRFKAASEICSDAGVEGIIGTTKDVDMPFNIGFFHVIIVHLFNPSEQVRVLYDIIIRLKYLPNFLLLVNI